MRSDDGADTLYTERTYEVESCLDPTIPGLVLAGENFVQALQRIEHKLKEDRRALVFNFGGGAMLNLPAGQDAANGPFPQSIRFTRFDGMSHCILYYTIKCHTIDCQGAQGQQQWLSNRWTESAHIRGDDFRTVRTRTGTIHIRPGPLFADAFRGIVTPPIPLGFLRTEAEYTVQSDGLALKYSFSDEEQYAMPIGGSVKAEGRASISVDKGIFKICEVSVKLTGDVKQNKQRLVQLASAVVMDRLERFGPARDKGGKFLIMSGAVTEQLYKNEVEVTMRTWLQPNTAGPSTNISSLRNAAGNFIRGQIGETASQALDDPRFGAIARGGLFLINPALGLGSLGIWFLTQIGPGGAGALASGALDNSSPMPKAYGVDSFKDKPLGSVLTDNSGVPIKDFRGNEIPAGSPDMGLRGTAGLGLVAAALNDPCLQRQIQNLQQQPPDPNKIRQPQAPFGPKNLSKGTLVVPTTAPPAASKYGETNISPSFNIIDNINIPNPNSITYLAGGVYTQYEMDLRDISDNNYAQLTEQRIGGLTHHIPLCATGKRMVLEWTATRAGEPPVIPNPNLGNSNIVLVAEEHGKPTLNNMSDDGVTLIYTQSGTYEYGFVDPSQAAIGAAVPPFMAALMGLAPRATFYGGPDLDNISGEGVLVGGPIPLSPWDRNLFNWQSSQPAGV